MDMSDLSIYNPIERDASLCFKDHDDEYITMNDLRQHTLEIMRKVEAVQKEITIGNAMIKNNFSRTD